MKYLFFEMGTWLIVVAPYSALTSDSFHAAARADLRATNVAKEEAIHV
jgi:hypothetical protein